MIKGPGVNITGQPELQAEGDESLSPNPIPPTPAQGQPALDRISEDSQDGEMRSTLSDELCMEY